MGDVRTGTEHAAADTERDPLVPRQRAASGHARPDGVGGPVPMVPTVVLIADPQRSTRDRLASELTGPHISLLLAAGVDAVEEIIADAPGGHLALVSLGFGAASPRLINGLRRVPWTRVVALASSVEPGPIMSAMAAGATGVLRGQPGGTDTGLPPDLGPLTPRELQVLRMVADGRSNKDIANELSVSALTVKSHLARISRKFGTGERSHQVAIALRAGLFR